MSGKPQFDDCAVLRAAIDVFWRRGFSAASISDLTAATGLSRSSLYQRFGDKDGLFQEAVARYTESLLTTMAASKGPSARARLEAMLLSYVPLETDRADRPAGCLLARSAAELTELSDAGRSLTRNGLQRQHALLAALLREAAASGELPAHADVDALAWHFLATLQAVVALPNAGASPDRLRSMIDVAMSVWPIPIAFSRRSAKSRVEL